MTGYHDYLILLSPSDSIINSVKKLKDQSFEKIGDFESRHSKGHITVAYWHRQKPEWVEPLFPKLERDVQRLSSVILNIDNFDFFSNQDNKTIYAKLVSTPATEIWFKQLRRFFSKPEIEPHITIAKSVPAEAFNKLWPFFKRTEWNEQFKVDKLTILRRETFGFESNYTVFKQMPFNRKLDFNDYTAGKLRAATLTLKLSNTQQFSLF